MTIINTLKVYEKLKTKLPEEQAKIITDVFESSFEEYRENQKEFLATKQDIAELRSEFKQEIAELRSNLIKWMFIFWTGQIGAVIGILLLFFKK